MGSPGSGKSTTLRWLVFQMAYAACLSHYRRLLYLLSRLLCRLFRLSFRWSNDLPEDLAPCQIPILFKVGEYAKANTPNSELVSVQAYLSSFLKSEYEHLPRLAERLLEELRDGHCLVLIDGLDEVANDHMRRQVAERIIAFCAHYAPSKVTTKRYNRFIITSRIVGYEANKFTDYTHYTLQDLDDEQIEEFLSHWCPVVERYRMQSAQSQRKLSLEQQAQANKEGHVHYQRLRDALKHNPGIKNLAINPLMLTLLALLQQSGKTLPHRRIELYQIVTRTLLDNWNQQTGRRAFPPTRSYWPRRC
jgi:predicted NACHT family NTPase